jgi:hypothetical protein
MIMKTFTVPLEISPGIQVMLCRRGFLLPTEISPNNIEAAIWGMLVAAIEAGVRAKPEPATAPPLAAAAPAPAAPPLAPTVPPPAAPPQRAKAAKAKVSPLVTADVEEPVESFITGPGIPGPLRTNGTAPDTEAEIAERRAAYFKRLSAATEPRPPLDGSSFEGE